MNSIARIAMRDIGSPSHPGGMPWSSRSSPEQKPRPAPVSTTAQVSLSAPDRCERVVERHDRVERHGVHPLGPVERDDG